MTGADRRKNILNELLNAKEPVSGSKLAKDFSVSRQVIVQDIALLRAENRNILSTSRGYVLYEVSKVQGVSRRAFLVRHGSDKMAEELYTIVDFGGTVIDTIIEHDVYGQITVDLLLHNRDEVNDFLEEMEKSTSGPLLALTDGVHIHTVEANSEALLDVIGEKLGEKGFLA